MEECKQAATPGQTIVDKVDVPQKRHESCTLVLVHRPYLSETVKVLAARWIAEEAGKYAVSLNLSTMDANGTKLM